jgi:hypothetical protein
MQHLKQKASENLHEHIEKMLPYEYQKSMIGINQVLKISWDIVHNDSTNNNNRLQALSLVNDATNNLL